MGFHFTYAVPGERGSEAGVGWGVGGWSPLPGKSWQTAQPPGPGRALQEDGGMDQTGNKSTGQGPHMLVVYCALAAGDSLTGSQAKRGCELSGPKIRNLG